MYGWRQWQARAVREQAQALDAGLRLDAIEQRFEAMRRDQRAQTQRLQQADATNRLLRDELLGIGQRAALLEDSVSRLADPDRHGAQALRLDEAELLLAMGDRRLAIAGDLDGARRAYALAGGVLEGVDDPAYLSLRQTLQQERAALDALGVDPRAQAVLKLDAFAADLVAAPPRATAADASRLPWWRRAFASIVEVQPSSRGVAVQPAERAAAQAGLELELSLARVAAERRDEVGYRAALVRTRSWLARLWPPSPALQRQQARLDALAALPLSLSVPTLGTTLEQLRQMRASP
ncbi:MAG: uroporphyrinogen-III C-methyltransferase [Lysobacter sp.]